MYSVRPYPIVPVSCTPLSQLTNDFLTTALYRWWWPIFYPLLLLLLLLLWCDFLFVPIHFVDALLPSLLILLCDRDREKLRFNHNQRVTFTSFCVQKNKQTNTFSFCVLFFRVVHLLIVFFFATVTFVVFEPFSMEMFCLRQLLYLMHERFSSKTRKQKKNKQTQQSQ